MTILAPRDYASDEERQMAQALNKAAEQMLKAVDAACRLRTAPGDAKRKRALMRTNLEQAANNGMDALAHTLHAQKGSDP